jgi:cytochrome c-type biogenesis protein CcmF
LYDSHEFWKGASAIAAKSGQNLIAAMVELTHRNTRRYGGYIVHIAIVIMFIGFTGSAFNLDATKEVAMNDTFKIGRYDLKIKDLASGTNAGHYKWWHAPVDVYVDGKLIDTRTPEQRQYTTAIPLRSLPSAGACAKICTSTSPG